MQSSSIRDITCVVVDISARSDWSFLDYNYVPITRVCVCFCVCFYACFIPASFILRHSQIALSEQVSEQSSMYTIECFTNPELK
jgi:hypothetical protein